MTPNFELLESQMSETEMALYCLLVPVYQALATIDDGRAKDTLHNYLESHILNFTVQGRPRAANIISGVQASINI